MFTSVHIIQLQYSIISVLSKSFCHGERENENNSEYENGEESSE